MYGYFFEYVEVRHKLPQLLFSCFLIKFLSMNVYLIKNSLSLCEMVVILFLEAFQRIICLHMLSDFVPENKIISFFFYTQIARGLHFLNYVSHLF